MNEVATKDRTHTINSLSADACMLKYNEAKHNSVTRNENMAKLV